MHAGPRRADLGGGLEFKALSIPTTEKDMGWILSRGTLPAAGHSLAVAAAAAAGSRRLTLAATDRDCPLHPTCREATCELHQNGWE